MRIIGGIYKNRRIDFKNLNIRPTTNFAKEGLFNILNNYYDLDTIKALDLFAGSGNISYEFASRRCQAITAVENNIKCASFMKKIKDQLQINNLEIKISKVNNYLKQTESKYNIIFLDPPYHYKQGQYDQIINVIFSKKIITESGTIVIEHSKFINFEHYPIFLKKKYGRVHFSFIKNEN